MGSNSGKEGVFKILLMVALLLLLHAAYSVGEWRSLTRQFTEVTSGQDDQAIHNDQTLPLDITIQTVFAFLLAMISVVQIAGDFKEIRASIEMSKRSWENASNRPSFYLYNHRGKAFSPDYVPPPLPSRRNCMEIPERFLS